MLFGYTDIPETLRKSLHEQLHSGTARHRGGHPDDLFVILRQITELFTENLRSALGAALFQDLATLFVERTYAVPVLVIPLGDLVTFTFDGLGVYYHRFMHLFCDLESLYELLYVMPVDGSDILEPHLFEEDTGRDHAYSLLHPFGHICGRVGKVLEHLLGSLLELLVKGARHSLGEYTAYRSYRLRYAHLVIV